MAYTGQSTRQILIEDLVGLMGTISDEVLAGRNVERYDTREEVYALLTPLYEEGGLADPSRPIPELVAEGQATVQSTYADFNDANLQSKLAGNDTFTESRRLERGRVRWLGDRQSRGQRGRRSRCADHS